MQVCDSKFQQMRGEAVTMNAASISRYWTIWRINLANPQVGYKPFDLSLARDFFQQLVNHRPNDDIQCTLLGDFYANHPAGVDVVHRGLAGLCLRCYVSYPIVKACQKIDSLFSGEKSFTYQDLLSCVLDDDGNKLVILDSDRKIQLVLDQRGIPQTATYKLFTVEILRKFKHDSQLSMSLDNWAYLQTKQNPELRKFLSEFGFQSHSDWSLLNRVRAKQLERLTERSRQLIAAFHAVYRRDRREKKQIEMGKCPDPTNAQLQEIMSCLQQEDIIINTTDELKTELKQVASQLRQYDIWSCREPLEIPDYDTGFYTLRKDLPTVSYDESNLEQQEFLEFLHQQFQAILSEAIAQEIINTITKLQNSKSYAPFAQKYLPGLQLYYCDYKSLKEIAPLLGMTSWDQTRRILNPGELLNKVRTLTVQKLLDTILQKAHAKGLTKIPPEPEYLKTLAEEIETFVDVEVFIEAGEEIRAGKNRSLNSLYAQKLRCYLETLLIAS
ncbi:unknown protein [Nostoc sp. NIES-3756]|nr:unknown protein [Nostoc sp. NIES-3756]